VVEDEGMQFVADIESLNDFFGTEVSLETPDVEPYWNCLKVEVEFENMRVWFTTATHAGFAEIRLVGQPFSVVKLSLTDISHLAIRKTAEDHYLLIKFARKLTSDLKLYLRPRVMLFWGNEAPNPDEDADLSIPTPPPSGDA
jgi:hypothetical protein